MFSDIILTDIIVTIAIGSNIIIIFLELFSFFDNKCLLLEINILYYLLEINNKKYLN